MKHLYIILLVLPFIGFGQNEYIKEHYKNGQLKFEGYLDKDQIPQGLIKTYYKNGQLNFEGFVKDGWEHGSAKGYYENGQLEFEGNFKNGKKNGLMKTYYKNGQLNFEGNYKDDEIISHNCWDTNGNKIDCE